MTKQLKAARAEVNRHAFGSAQWEQAMQTVRALVEKINTNAPKFAHTSIDGDVWSI